MELPEGFAGALADENSRKALIAGGAIAALILAILAYFFLFSGPSSGELTVKVSNDSGQPLWRASVSLTGLEGEFSDTTNRTGAATFKQIPTGKEFTVEASGEGFKGAQKKIMLNSQSSSVEITLVPEATSARSVKTLKFIGPNGESLSGKPLFVSVSCTGGIGMPNPEREVLDGTLKVEAPAGCGNVIARVSAPGFESNNYTMQGSGTIRLQSLEHGSGSAKISVSDSAGSFLEGIEVVIKDSRGIPTGEKKLTSFGDALFTLPAANYSAYVYDPALKFSDSEKTFTVTSGGAANVAFRLTDRPVGTINVRVLDAGSGAEINRAQVLLESPSGKKTSRDYTGKQLAVGIMENGISKLNASADGYAPGATVQIDSKQIGTTVYTIRLEKCAPATCSILKVTVLDEDGLAVQNARIALTDSKTGFYDAAAGLRHTNFDGVASFSALGSGSYSVLAQKYPAQGSSDAFEFRQGQSKEITTRLTIGSGTIEIKAVDESGNAVPFAFATLATDYNTLGRLPLDAQGKAAFSTKADKKVFAIVEAQGYSPYTSTSYQIFSGQTTAITATLAKQSLADSVKINFLGLFDENDKPVAKMAAGNVYRARFSLNIPTGGQFAQVGAFIRAGNETLVEKDGIYIDSINAPGASVIRGSSYNEPNGIAIDSANITNGEAKWATIAWDRGRAWQGTIEFFAQLHVRDSVTPAKALPLFYRAYGITSAGKFKRDQVDAELGESENTSAKNGLYAKSYQKDFFEGSTEECTPEFCYSERMLDISQGLLIPAPYTLKVFSDYEFSFALTDNSNAVHDKASLGAKNSANGTTTEQKLQIKNYTIVNADAQSVSSITPAFEMQPVPLGNFRKNKSVTGKFTLAAQDLGPTSLQLQMASDKQVVFNRLVKVTAVKEKDINVSVFPQTLPAFTDFDITVSAALLENAGNFLGLEGALVRVERITPDRVKSVFTATTGPDGSAVLKIPASAPGTKINVTVQKAGYLGAGARLEVSRDIISFRPARISSTLNLTSKPEEKIPIEATSLVPLGLKLSDLRLRGNFRGLLDEARVNNWLGQYPNKTALPFGSPVQISVLTAISENAKRLDSAAGIDATLHFEVSNEGKTITWPLEIPAKIAINLAEPPKENGCLEVGLKEWKDSTLGGKAQAEFTITNSCLSQDGRPLDLRSLKVSIKWKSNKLGNVELHVQNPDTGQEASEVLSEGTYATLFDSVPGQKEMIALLTFTPKGGTSGKRAEFSVLLDAGQQTNAGEQLVGASNPIESELDIIDLAGCIKYTPDAEAGIVMQQTDEEADLQIDSSRCGNVDIDFWLCKDNKGCSGGAEGGILVKPDKFHLSAASPTKKVQVSRQEIPGIYGINVNIRTPRSNYREIATVDALIKPAANDAFSLRKYEFTLKGNAAKDSTELTNHSFVQNINVDASVCDWGEASEKKWWNWTGAGVGAVVGALKGMVAANAAAHGASKSLASTVWSKLFGAKAAQKAAAGATKASAATLEGVCGEVQSAQSSVVSAQGVCASTAAGPFVTAAVGPFETAVAQCQAAQKQSEALAPVDDSIGAGLASGITPLGGVGGLAPAASGIAGKQGAEAGVKASLTAAAAQLQAAATSLGSGDTALAQECSAGSEGCAQCQPNLSQAVAQTQAASAHMSSFIGEHFAESTAKTAASAAGIAGTQAAAGVAQTAMAPSLAAATTASAAFSPGTIFAAYTIGGFFIGGVLPGLFGTDPCSQRHSNDLPDYMINILTDAGKIDSGEKKLAAAYDAGSARVIGNYKEQRIGVVFTNNGVSSPRPVYSTFTFNANQHVHSNPTKIDRGNSSFGPFNVPDREKVDLQAKLHLKFKTQEPEETLPDLEFDTLACVSGNKIGRTGEKALPKIKLNWGFGQGGIDKDTCLEDNPKGVYCDAAQFSIMLSKRLNSLKGFFDRNPNLKCPANPLYSDLAAITKDLNVLQANATSQGCYITSWSGYLEGEPAIKTLIDANEKNIQWTAEIPNKQAFMDTIHFNALLIQDGYTQDFMRDFSQQYTTQRFFDTPDWFTGIATDAAGKKYGIGRLFEGGKVKLTNRFYDSPRLSSAGTYEVLLNVEGDDGSFRFFKPDGIPNAKISLETYLLQEPNPNSVFYSLPFDGLVGLEGDTFERQGYGTSFNNKDSAEFVNINRDPSPVKTYNDSGSNPIVAVNSGIEKRFYELNTSPSGRGSLLIAQSTGAGKANLSLRPTHATPVMLKVNAAEPSRDNLAAYYTLTSSEVPVDVGNTLTYWDGAGACLDPSGLIITQAFDDKADRAATSKDLVLNWQSAYAVDFGATKYTGNAYIRTIFYTNPLEEVSLTAEQPNSKVQFLTPDGTGLKVKLNGVGGVPFNNPSGGSGASALSVSDVCNLVRDQRVCVVDSGRKASFFWNPKAVYEMAGKERNISEVTNSLAAGKTCIGFG